jgi:hypothetical protein
MDQPTKISTALESAISDLLLRDPAIIEAGRRVFSEDVFLPDLFVASVLNRTLQLLHGFVALVRNRNYLSATPLYRLQLDNGLRLWAAHLVESFDVFTSEVLNGKRIDKMKSKNGERLTDHYLVASLAEYLQLPELPTAYEYASGFVHLSGQHIFATHWIEHKVKLSGRIARLDEATDEAKWLDLIKGFSSATDVALALVNAWASQKDEERLRREKV